jgi:hypothetical protein
MEEVQGFDGGVAGNGAMDDVAGDPPHVAGVQRFGFAADGEGQLPFEEHTHLLVRMTVWLHHGARLKLNQREHHLLASHGVDVDAGEDFVMGSFGAGDEVRHC